MNRTEGRQRYARTRQGTQSKPGKKLKLPGGIALQGMVCAVILLVALLLISLGGGVSENVSAAFKYALGTNVNLGDINEELAIFVQGVPFLRDIFSDGSVPANAPATQSTDDPAASTNGTADTTGAADVTDGTEPTASAQSGQGGGMPELMNVDSIPIETDRVPYDGSDAVANPLEYIEIDTDSSGFGVVYESVSLPVALELPLDGVVTSPFGARVNPITGDAESFHHGVDIGTPEGAPIAAAAGGRVAAAGWSDVYGNYILLDHGSNQQTFYGHCLELAVAEGDEVASGDTIARVGSTGWSTGSHLHFEVRLQGCFLDPTMNSPLALG